MLKLSAITVILLEMTLAVTGCTQRINSDADNFQMAKSTQMKYSRVFWGRMEKVDEIHLGLHYRLRDIKTVIGDKPHCFQLPFKSIENFTSSPFEYVEGRRYMVFMVKDAKAPKKDGNNERVIAVLDLDMTKGEKDTIALFDRNSHKFYIPQKGKEFTRAELDKWFASLQPRIDEGILTVSDIAYVLGKPKSIHFIDGKKKGSKIEVVYELKFGKLLKATKQIHDFDLLGSNTQKADVEIHEEYPVIKFVIQGTTVMSAQKNISGSVTFSNPDGEV